MKKYTVPSMEILDIKNDAIYTACYVDMYNLFSGDDNGGSCGYHDNGSCPKFRSGEGHCDPHHNPHNPD